MYEKKLNCSQSLADISKHCKSHSHRLAFASFRFWNQKRHGLGAEKQSALGGANQQVGWHRLNLCFQAISFPLPIRISQFEYRCLPRWQSVAKATHSRWWPATFSLSEQRPYVIYVASRRRNGGCPGVRLHLAPALGCTLPRR